MGNQTVTVNTANQLYINNDSSQVFIGNTFTRRSESVTNSTYDAITISVGTVMGRVTASNTMIPFKSTAVDGSQIPRGLMNSTVIIPAGEQVELPIVISGEVATNKLVFERSGDSITTSVGSLGLVQDLLGAIGIKLVNSREMTEFDNPQT
jgi:hypothetical protein